jgi:hypothetical protein
MLNTPILFLVFNRPETTRQIFAAIRRAQPKQLFIAADGPRENVASDREKCALVREIIAQSVDWDCEVKTLFRVHNLGCKNGVTSALDWFFDNVEEGIILEDDCLPSASFFSFCTAMLEKYRNDTRIMQISGLNVENISDIKESYLFSRFSSIWGWATWKRAWRFYDREIKSWPYIRGSKDFRQFVNSYAMALMLKYNFNLVYNKKVNSWDYQWQYCALINSGLAIVPVKNMIKNVGFSTEATHCLKEPKFHKALELHEMSEKLVHPVYMFSDKNYEDAFYHKAWGGGSFIYNYIQLLRRRLAIRARLKILLNKLKQCRICRS